VVAQDGRSQSGSEGGPGDAAGGPGWAKPEQAGGKVGSGWRLTRLGEVSLVRKNLAWAR
jgi:hypothetical protein